MTYGHFNRDQNIMILTSIKVSKKSNFRSY